MARLTKIGVGGYKSIRDLQSLEIHPLNVLIGANGAGKSNLLSYLRLLRAFSRQKLQDFIGQAGGPDSLLYYGMKQTPEMWGHLETIGKTGKSRHFFRLGSAANDTLVFRHETIERRFIAGGDERTISLGSGHRESSLPEDADPHSAISGIRVFHFEDTSETAGIRRRVYMEDNRELREDAANLPAFLYRLQRRQPDYYSRIVAGIRQIAPFFDDFDLGPMGTDPHSILLNWRDRYSDRLFGPHQLSDGTLRAMALVALLGQPEEDLPAFIALDEPEIGLHPYAVEMVAGWIKSASIHRPVLVATQSASLVNRFSADDIITVSRDGAQSRFERQDAENLSAWLEEYAMGDLWERNLIGGNPFR